MSWHEVLMALDLGVCFFFFFFSLTQELFGFFGVGVLFIDEILLEEEECMD